MKQSRLWAGIGIWLAGAMLAAAAPVDWDFYASARVFTFVEDKDTADGKTFADGEDSDLNYEMGLLTTSRLGARVKVDDNVSGLMEISLAESGVNLRHLVGYWDFGPGKLSIGQTRTPVGRQDSLRTRNDDLGLTAFGEPYLGRRPLLQLEMYGVKLAVVKPHSITNIYTSTNTTSEVDNPMPRVEVSWTKKAGISTWDLFGGFHTYTISSPEEDFDVQSGMIGGGLMLKPDPVYIRAIGYYARNARQFGQYLSPQPASFGSAKISEDDEVIDNDVLAGALFGGYKFSDRVKAEIGYGYIQSKDDASGADTEKWQCYYAQATVTLYKGFTVTPEVGVMEDIETNQRVTYAGAKWQANF
ncbi:MAG: hypothetical protein GX548_05370 [Lentisphaerae bacterium]|nr:hypothetical protein [Lentisphaerota bacterium]